MVTRVQVELVPEADADVREAVRAALARTTRADGLLPDAARGTAVQNGPGAWRRRALAEGVDRDPGYASAPRSSRGAARA
jgi:hypothetical protein